MRILLLGKNGQVGWELQRALAPLGEMLSCDVDSPGARRADFNRPEAVATLVRKSRPTLVVNAAAYTAVDQAEEEPEVARRINATAPALIAAECAKLDALLVHYSSDYVFDGSGDQARDESAPAAPLSVYGQTKLEGDLAIRASGCRHLILRTSWVYSARGGNFARTMLRLAAERDTLNVVNDQIGAPTGADLLADVTAHAVRRMRSDATLDGIYHCVPSGETSWHGYAMHLIEGARAAGWPLRVLPQNVLGLPSAAYPTKAKRPMNSRLKTQKLRDTFNLHLPSWKRGVDRLLAELALPARA